MKRLMALGSVLVLAVALTGASFAGEAAAAPASVKGWLVDSFCGAKNANLDGQGCAKDCYKKGAKLQLVADGKTYELSDQKAAAEHLGHEVVVTGTVDKDTIKVTKIEPATKEKA